MAVSTFTQPNFNQTGLDGNTYKTNIDDSINVLHEFAGNFACHEQATPNMTVRVDAGRELSSGVVTIVAAQNTGTITAPAANNRIDLIEVNASGVVNVVTGTEDPSPTTPTATSGSTPIASVLLTPSHTEIVNSDITDLRTPSSRTQVDDTTIEYSSGTLQIKDSGVSTAKIADNAISLAKMSSGTAGNLITYDASGDPAAVTTGTSGQVLTSNGAGAAPTFQTVSSDYDEIDVITVSSPQPDVEFTSIPTGYTFYVVSGSNISPVNNGVNLQMQVSTDNGSSYIGGSSYQQAGVTNLAGGVAFYSDGGSARHQIALDIGNAAGEGVGFDAKFLNLKGNLSKVAYISSTGFDSTAGSVTGFTGSASVSTTSAIDAIKLFFSSGDINAGVFKIYGIK